jgi:integrase
MKMKERDVVPLSKQTIEVLEEIKRVSSGTELLFPYRTDILKPISDNTLSKMLQNNGYRNNTVHGFKGETVSPK